MKKYKRNCPKCKKKLFSNNESYIKHSEKIKRVCSSCAKRGKNNPMYGNHCNQGQIPWNKGKKISSDIEKRKVYKRNCPKCNGIIKYTLIRSMKRAKQNKNLCVNCCKKGLLKGRKFSKQTRLKMSKNHHDISGKNNPMFGKKHSVETKRKLRLLRIKEIKEKFGQCIPNYNPKAISILEQKAKELGITDLRHAENGGEYHIQKLGYIVDGYSPSKNIVIEYYEPFHKKQIERDERRKQEIINYLNCKFIEIKEWKL